jgi:hypothetical protein
LARSKPAGGYCHTGALAHADAEAANTYTFTCPCDRYTDRDGYCHCHRDAASHAYAYRYLDTDNYTDADLDRNAEAADCDAVSDPHAIADSGAGGSIGAGHARWERIRGAGGRRGVGKGICDDVDRCRRGCCRRIGWNRQPLAAPQKECAQGVREWPREKRK